MEPLSIQEALDYCLENPEGLGAQELLDLFPQYREELEPLLGLAHSVTELAPPSIPTPRRDAMKARLMASASTPPTRPAQSAEALPVPASRPAPPPAVKPLPLLLQPRWLFLAAALLLIAFVWWSAARALPGNPFYNVKLASESVMLTLANDPPSKAIMHTEIANSRLYDLRALQAQNTLALAAPALDSFSRNVTAADEIEKTLPAGEARMSVIMSSYMTCYAGRVTLAGIKVESITLPPSISDSIQRIEVKVEDIAGRAEQALVAEGILPASVILDPRIQPLLTPVPGIPLSPAESPTAVPSIAAQPTSTATSIILPSDTPTSLPQPSDTPVPAEPSPTETPTPTVPPPATDTPTSAPTVPNDTATPLPTDTSTPTLEPVLSPTTELDPTSTSTVTPPPSSTPEPPQPTSTIVTEPQDPPEPSPTPEPALGTVCDLRVANLEAECEEGGTPGGQACISWTATVRNMSETLVQADWSLELQVRAGAGGFATVRTVTGSDEFDPGDADVGDSICYDFPGNAQAYRLRFTILTTGNPCSPDFRQSAPEDVCDN